MASVSGDVRGAFDLLRTTLQRHVADGNGAPIGMAELAKAIDAKYGSKVASVLRGLPREHQMVIAAIYMKLKTDGKEYYKYDEVYGKVSALTGRLGLERTAFSEFCESVKILEFYGLLKAQESGRSVYASKVPPIQAESR